MIVEDEKESAEGGSRGGRRVRRKREREKESERKNRGVYFIIKKRKIR